MVTIFDGFAQLSDDEIRGQIALLRCITMSNAMKEVIQLTNVRKMVDGCYNDLAESKRDELDEILKQELIKKCQAASGLVINETVTADALHVMIVREAARVYMIDDYKTPGQKADEIHDKYYEHYLKVLQKKIGRMTEEENARLEMQIQKAIAQSDIEDLRRLATEMMLREFNGKTIRIRIASETGTTMLKKLIDVMGMRIFDGIEGVIDTANDSMLMFCRIERAILAQCVWTAVNGYGKRMRLPDDLMPSYSSGLLQEENEKEKYLMILTSREKQLNKILRGLLGEIDKYNKQQVIQENSRDRDCEKLKKMQEEYEEALDFKEKTLVEGVNTKKAYEEYIKDNPVKNNSDIKYRKLKQDYENLARDVRNGELKITSTKKNISRLEESIENRMTQIEKTNQKLAGLREELVLNVQEFNEVITNLENEAGYRTQVLRRKWNAYYETLEFDKGIYESVVKCFTRREIVSLERMLKEMDTCDTKKVFASASEGGACVAFCLVNAGKHARIIYNDCQITKIQVKGRQP